ncbi:MAG: tyrosine-type recombinase/integrase [Myxococcales bacterium]|nr:tyrosine-type recombinase/integrase [Myxococcales bacterium]
MEVRRLSFCQSRNRKGVRQLRLHDARHTFASLALASGKSVKWISNQLGHANPEVTLRIYAHQIPEEDNDLSFLDFGGTKRHPRGTNTSASTRQSKAIGASGRKGGRFMERETGFEPIGSTASAPSAWEGERGIVQVLDSANHFSIPCPVRQCHVVT